MTEVKGRKLSSYFQIYKIFSYIKYIFRCFVIFEKPLTFLYSYLFYKPLKIVKLRNGYSIYLSGHPHDCITIFAIFVRRDYGYIGNFNSVIDIGGNIGIFALYSMISGTKKCISYEPNSKAIEYAKNNIKLNKFEKYFQIHRLAVSDFDNSEIFIPKEPSMYNSIKERIYENSLDYEKCKTISLKSILDNYEQIDLVKIDCEGAEYSILFNCDKESLQKVSHYRLEFHKYKAISLINFFAENGYINIYSDTDLSKNPKEGILWFCKITDKI